jgi:hypothetical protein
LLGQVAEQGLGGGFVRWQVGEEHPQGSSKQPAAVVAARPELLLQGLQGEIGQVRGQGASGLLAFAWLACCGRWGVVHQKGISS